MRAEKVGETVPYPHSLCEEARYLRDVTRFQNNNERVKVRH